MLVFNNIFIFQIKHVNPVHIQTARQTQPAIITQF